MTLQQIYNRLKLTEDKGCLVRLSDNDWDKKVDLPSRVLRLLKKNEKLKTLDAFFCFDKKPLVLFFENPDENKKQELHQAIWNFNESPIAIIVRKNVVEIFNGFAIDENTKLLKLIGGEERLDDFTYFKLVTGKTWEQYTNEINHKSRVDYRLLNNIAVAQDLLKKQNLSQVTANALLGKIIFFRYLIDRHIRLNFKGKVMWTNDDLCKCLKNINEFHAFVQYIEQKFNGDMFPIKKFDSIKQEALNILVRLLQSEELSTGQMSLFDLYDFSILPIEFISNIYEKFIGIEKQDEESAYYTPTFLVDYIVSETVGKKLNESNGYYCKVLDPACGSGIFLVESLRRIIEKYIDIHKIKNTNTINFQNSLKQIVTDNIFGIDKDESAIQVAVFSVYLTLLDYQSPADIEQFKFPNLLNSNFIHADTFDVNNDNIKRIESGGVKFDYIIGNPPWMRGRIEYDTNGQKTAPLYKKYLSSKKYNTVVGNKEIAQAFVVRSLDFSNPDTIFAFVLTSKVLYNLRSKNFRRFILDNMYLNQVFELASVRREVFDSSKATTPACVLIYKNADGGLTDNHSFQHIALKPSRFFRQFKVFSLSRNDIQVVHQKLLKEYDWLWKTLVYGSYLDFNFIKRLKQMKSIKDELCNHNVLIKQGIKRKDGKKETDTTSLKGWNFLNLRKEIEQFYISKSHSKWDTPRVGYIYKDKDTKDIDTSIYTAPMLLIKECVNTHLESVSSVSNQNLLFTDKITSIKFMDKNSYDYYYAICGIINSSLFAYYVMQSSSTAGIMIEQQINDEERFNFPFLYSKTLVDSIKKLCFLHNKKYAEALHFDNEIDDLKKKIDLHLCELLHMSPAEIDLWNYTKDVIIPLVINRSDSVLKCIDAKDSKNLLHDYAQVYVNRFSKSFNRVGKSFVVEIHYSSPIIGMFFKIIDKGILSNDIKWYDSNDVLFPEMIRLTSEKITDRLFVQKDIRGFEKDSFYIFKPNEARLWHKAIAYLDVDEFADAILRTGGNGYE